ncbi:unnamed protein product, partial [Musa textilis]
CGRRGFTNRSRRMKLPTGGYPPLSSGMLASFVTCADAAMAGIMPPPLLELQLPLLLGGQVSSTMV